MMAVAVLEINMPTMPPAGKAFFGTGSWSAFNGGGAGTRSPGGDSWGTVDWKVGA